MAVARHEAFSSLTTLVVFVVFFSIGFVNGVKRLVALSLAPCGVTHNSLLLAEA